MIVVEVLVLFHLLQEGAKVFSNAPQHQLHGGARVLAAVVARRATLDVPLEVALRQGLEAAAVGEAVVVRERDGRVDDGGVHDAQRTQVVLQAVAHEHGVRINEAHQVVLHLAQRLRQTLAAEVARRDAREARVVVDDVALRPHQTIVNQASVRAHHRHLGQLQATHRVAHLTVQRVHAQVAVGRRRAPRPGACVAVEGPVEADAHAVPHVQFPDRTAGAPDFRPAARVHAGPGKVASHLAPVVHAVLLRQVLAVAGHEEAVSAAHALALLAGGGLCVRVAGPDGGTAAAHSGVLSAGAAVVRLVVLQAGGLTAGIAAARAAAAPRLLDLAVVHVVLLRHEFASVYVKARVGGRRLVRVVMVAGRRHGALEDDGAPGVQLALHWVAQREHLLGAEGVRCTQESAHLQLGQAQLGELFEHRHGPSSVLVHGDGSGVAGGCVTAAAAASLRARLLLALDEWR